VIRIARQIAASALPLGLVIGSASAQAPADTARLRYTAADVAFMQGMIAHHAQAIEMAALVATRSTREDMHLLAQRIDVSQRDEIATMQRWLRSRHQEAPGLDASRQHHDADGHPMLMPGMLTPEEMAALAAATGPEFERLFLQGMIKHHQGALKMVADLFASHGAAQEPQISEFATDVDADQRAEIARMTAMLSAYPTVKREPR
jgi:uncharacterized protein (DUF305 family)